jgi:hypothetical protein
LSNSTDFLKSYFGGFWSYVFISPVPFFKRWIWPAKLTSFVYADHGTIHGTAGQSVVNHQLDWSINMVMCFTGRWRRCIG